MAKKTTKKSTKKASTAAKTTKKTKKAASKVAKKASEGTKPAAAAAAAAGPSPALVDLEKALAPFMNRDWQRALELLTAVAEKHPDAIEIRDRVRSYRLICERQLEQAAPSPTTADELYQLGILRLNDGAFDEAREVLERAVELQSDSDKAHYALAAVLALSEEPAGALEHLRRAIELNEENRIFAGNDSDLELLRDEVEFLELTGRTRPAGGLDEIAGD